MRHFLKRSSYASGSTSSTRWPTAHVITYSSPSRKTVSILRPRVGFSSASRAAPSSSPSAAFFVLRFVSSSGLRRVKVPGSASARSRPTEGFSAMISVLAMDRR